MSIPDDPFNTSSASPPRLHVDAEHAPPEPSPPRETNNATPAYTPGGSLMVPSTSKPSRRVQWTNDSHIVTISPIPSNDHLEDEPVSPTQQLDERNIDAVHAALERHRTNPSRKPRPQSTTLSIASSAGTSVTGTDDDYDYRLDVDPEPPLHAVTSDGSQRFGGDSEGIVDLLENDARERADPSQYIPLGETDGLPSMPSANEKQDGLDDAKNLVRAHTGKWGVLRRRVRTANAVSAAFGPGSGAGGRSARRADVSEEKQMERDENQEQFARRYPSVDRRASRLDAPPQHMGMPGGASVLSSLLALYGQQSGLESGTTSAASSRPTSPELSSDEEGGPRHGRRRDPAGHDLHIDTNKRFQGHTRDSNESSPSGSGTPIHPVVHDQRRPSQLIHPDGTVLTQHASRSVPNLIDRPPPSPGILEQFKRLKDGDYWERPKAARSGAGVFGALIQNTNNLSGFATPSAAALSPAADRPGFQLSRFAVPTASAAAHPKHWRPESLTPSRPGSVHSSTAVSNNGDSPQDERPFRKTLSTDDVYSLREKEGDTPAQLPYPQPGHTSAKKKRIMTLDNVTRLPVNALKESGNVIRNAEKWVMSGGKTPLRTPDEKASADYFARPLTEDERRRKEWEREKKKRKKAKEARKKHEIFIIQHVAAILARQQFLLKLARSLMMFGSPSHRLETQIQATAKVLELNCQVVYLPGTMLISFGDDATHTSETKFLKQATGLDLGKLLATHNLYWEVTHDKIAVDDASKDLDVLMTTPVYYNWWQTLIIGAFSSAFITVIGFSGSFIDALMAMPLGALLCGVQMLSARNDMFSNVFEIAIATIISFIAAALASTQVFCYTALVSGGVVLILPGYIVLCGALELASRNITAGAVRIGYSVIYSLFLGFGISIGAELYHTITGLTVVGADDYQCSSTHAGKPWYGVTPSQYWYFLCCPGFPLMLALRNQQPLFAKELPIMVLIACAGWCSNHFSAIPFPNRSDLTSAIGSFVVGTLGNLYGRMSNGSSFPVTVVGILFQLPSGLANGGIFSFASESTSGSGNAYSDGFQVAEQLISVAIGLTVGLFVSAVVTHPFGGGRKRGSGIFSF